MKQTDQARLADKIAHRETELHRRYDQFTARRHALWQQIETARIELIGLDAGIAQCQKRAAEQGYPGIL